MQIFIQKFIKDIFAGKHTSVLLASAVSFFFLVLVYDWSWIASDDGVMAYLADQVHQGKVYGKDIIDTHGGYQTFLNALMFEWFGRDVVVLRYPIILLTILQSMIVAHLTRKKGVLISVSAALVSVFCGFLYWPNPSPNLYALFFAFLSVYILSEWRSTPARNIVLGAVVGVCFMFRHPSAIFLGIGIICYLLYQESLHEEKIENKLLVMLDKVILLLILAALLVYTYLMADIFVFFIIAMWPILVLTVMLFRKTGLTPKTLKEGFQMFIGFVTGVVPVIAYQLVWGDFWSWFEGVFLDPASIVNQSFFESQRYIDLLLGNTLPMFYSGGGVSDNIFYTVTFASILVVGFAVVTKVVKGRPVSPSLMVAVYFGFVSVYYQYITYLFFSLSLFVLALIQMINVTDKRSKLLVAGGLLFLSFYSWLAISPVSPFYKSYYVASDLPGVSLFILSFDNLLHTQLVDYLDEVSEEGQEMYVIPSTPQLHFMTRLQSPSKYWATMFELSSTDDLAEVEDMLSRKEVTVVVYDSEHFYTSSYDRMLVDWLETESPFCLKRKIGKFWVFQKVIESECVSGVGR